MLERSKQTKVEFDAEDGRKAVGHTRRLVAEQISQLLSILTILLDRVLLTAVFFRFWGETAFETWSVLLSLAGLIGLSEFGFSMYFNNAVALALQRGDKSAAVRTFAIGFTLLSLASLCGWLIVVLIAWHFLPGQSVESAANQTLLVAVVAVLALAAALRIPMTVVSALYRAHLRFAQFSLVSSGAELLRILLTVLAVTLLGSGFLGVATLALLTSVLLQVGYFLVHARRLYPEFELKLLLPSQGERREIASLSTAYLSQTVSTILLTSLPVLLLEREASAAGVVAAFVIIRTLMGMPRTILQSIGIVIGYESARLLSRNDSEQAMTVVGQATQTIAIASGLVTGALLAIGSDITHVWLSNRGVFVESYAIAAGLPLVVAAASVVSHNILVCANTPYLAAIGRFLQLGLTGLLFFVLPIADPGLRMLVALGLGEVFGYALLSYVAVYRMIDRADLLFHGRMIAISLVACAASWLAIGWFSQSVGDDPLAVMAKMSFSAIFCCLVFIFFGLNAEQRREIARLLRLSGQGTQGRHG